MFPSLYLASENAIFGGGRRKKVGNPIRDLIAGWDTLMIGLNCNPLFTYSTGTMYMYFK